MFLSLNNNFNRKVLLNNNSTLMNHNNILISSIIHTNKILSHNIPISNSHKISILKAIHLHKITNLQIKIHINSLILIKHIIPIKTKILTFLSKIKISNNNLIHISNNSIINKILTILIMHKTINNQQFNQINRIISLLLRLLHNQI